MLKLPDGTTKVLVEGGERVRISEYTEESGFFEAHWELIPVGEAASEKELEVTMRSLVSLFEQYVKLNRKIPPELLTTMAGIEDPSRLADTVAAHLAIRLEEKQVLLEMGSARRRMEHEGVVLTATNTLMAELAQDWSRPEGGQLLGILFQDVLPPIA